MKLRPITVDEFINFVRAKPGKYPTAAGKVEFTVEPNGDGVLFVIKDGKHKSDHKPCSRALLQRFVAAFNRKLSYSTYKEFGVSSYLVGVARQIQESKPVTAILNSLSTDELEILKAPETEREELRKSRIGQGRFRTRLLNLRQSCYVTGLAEEPFLRASHIKPWSESNNEERLDPHNGLLLCPNFDLLFDLAFISFQDDGRILVSDQIPQSIAAAFGINPTFQGADLGAQTKTYLACHRARFQRLRRARCPPETHKLGKP